MVCNVCTILYVPDNFIKLIEKEVFAFIWDDRMELISRNCCYFPKCKGGISLNEIRIKIASLQLAQISKIVFDESEISWVDFGHFWLGIQLKRFLDYEFSNNIPHCIEELPNYYECLRDMLNFIKTIDSSIVPSKGAHCKFFYLKLMNAFVKLHGLNVEKKFTDVDFSIVFANIIDRCIDPFCLNVTFKLAHYVLPVADRLYNFGIRIDRLCSLCKHENETIEHLFLYCTHVQWSKKFLVSWLHDICQIGLSVKTVILSCFDKKISRNHLQTILIILSEYRYCIWTARNRIRYEKKRISPFDLASMFINRIQYRILIDFQRLEECKFEMIWTHDTLCKIENGQLCYNFKIEKP